MKPELNSTIDSMKEKEISFQDAWASLVSSFAMLKESCGGIGTVLPNTETVKSGFSRLSLENNEYRKASTEFSLEIFLHRKQFAELTALE